MKPAIKTSVFRGLCPMSAAVGGLPHLSHISDGVCLSCAVEQMHKVTGAKAGSEAEPRRYCPDLDEGLYRVVV